MESKACGVFCQLLVHFILLDFLLSFLSVYFQWYVFNMLNVVYKLFILPLCRQLCE